MDIRHGCPAQTLRPTPTIASATTRRLVLLFASVPSHELVGLIDPDRVLMGGDPFCLFDDDP